MKQKKLFSLVGALVLMAGTVFIMASCKQDADSSSNTKTEIPSEYVASYEGTLA